MIFDEIVGLVGKDTLEIFGESGSGKSSFATTLVNEVKDKGKVCYIDSERNILLPPENITYFYCSSLNMVYDTVMAKMPRECMLVVLDSLGLPVLGEFASLDAHGKGMALLKAEAITYRLKRYSQDNDALVLILNQPESTFAKGQDYTLQPFGDKHIYFCKEVWKSSLITPTPDLTACNILSFRSRKFGRGTLLYSVNISGPPDNVQVEVKRQWK